MISIFLIANYKEGSVVMHADDIEEEEQKNDEAEEEERYNGSRGG